MEDNSNSHMNECVIVDGRGYQRVGENVTLGQSDLHEAIDVWHYVVWIIFKECCDSIRVQIRVKIAL